MMVHPSLVIETVMERLLSAVLNVEVSDTTGDDKREDAGQQMKSKV